MRVDYYIGREPEPKLKIQLYGHFYGWYELISHQLDARIISVAYNDLPLLRTLKHLLYASKFPVIGHRRKNSILHITNIFVAFPLTFAICDNPLVVTCWDTIPFEENADDLAFSRSGVLFWGYKKILEKADKVIAISQYTKKRIVDIFRLAPEKVEVVYLAVNHQQFYRRELSNAVDLKQRFGLHPEKKNILYVGSEHPRKNLERVISSLALIRDSNFHFVKVGRSGKDTQIELRETITRLDLEDKVHFQGIVRQQDLPLIYNLADVFVFPSLYEGFGLPILEALACGCPVVTSNLTSIPEVAGSAVQYVDPYSTESIANGVSRLLTDTEYCANLVKLGYGQAKKFNLPKTVDETIKVYNKLIAN